MSKEEQSGYTYGPLDRSILSVGVGIILVMSFAVYGSLSRVRDYCEHLAEQQDVIIKNQRQLQDNLETLNENVLRIL